MNDIEQSAEIAGLTMLTLSMLKVLYRQCPAETIEEVNHLKHRVLELDDGSEWTAQVRAAVEELVGRL